MKCTIKLGLQTSFVTEYEDRWMTKRCQSYKSDQVNSLIRVC
jgi:hypothetical protein